MRVRSILLEILELDEPVRVVRGPEDFVQSQVAGHAVHQNQQVKALANNQEESDDKHEQPQEILFLI